MKVLVALLLFAFSGCSTINRDDALRMLLINDMTRYFNSGSFNDMVAALRTIGDLKRIKGK